MNYKKYIWTLRAIFYSVLYKNIKLPSYIGKPMYLNNFENCFIGKNCRIYPGSRIELVNKNSFFEIGDNVSIGQNFHAVSYNSKLSIGNNVTISGNVFITNCDHTFDILEMHVLNQPLSSKKTKIGDYCFIGYGSVIMAGTELGVNCVIGTNSTVKGKYPNNCMLAGSPAKIIKKYNEDLKKWIKV
ncbi:MAG: DapH/DapD/GlmU-related protein [Bacilli bacterium]